MYPHFPPKFAGVGGGGSASYSPKNTVIYPKPSLGLGELYDFRKFLTSSEHSQEKQTSKLDSHTNKSPGAALPLLYGAGRQQKQVVRYCARHMGARNIGSTPGVSGPRLHSRHHTHVI